MGTILPSEQITSQGYSEIDKQSGFRVVMPLVCSPQQVIDVQSERDGVGGGGQGLRGSHDQSKKVRGENCHGGEGLPGKSKALAPRSDPSLAQD